MHRLFGDSPIPRYVQLADLLRRRIAQGELKAGDQLPTLQDLTREFEVARVTARQAVDVLQREGLISAQQGRGTFVTAAPPPGRRLRLQTTLADLANVYRDDKPHLTLIEESALSPALQPGEGTAAARYQYMRRVHSRDGVAYCVISIYLDQRVFRRAPRRFRTETVIPVLLETPGVEIAAASQTLAIGAADVEVAHLLSIPVNSPVAEVRRVCVDPGGIVSYLGLVTYRGDYIHLEMDLKP